MFNFSRMALSLCSAFIFLAASALNAQSPVACPGFKTWTQGGYGASSNGQPVQFLNANFAAAFPAGLEIGCTNKIRLTSASAVRNFLPQGTAPNYLKPGTTVNPTKSNFNSVLAGQLVTLTLNVGFDKTFASFGSSSTNLKDLVITTGPFLGWTVQEFLDDANKKIGGCTSLSSASYSAYNTAADLINRAYDNGVSSGNFLACPMTVNCSSTNAVCFDTYTGSMTVNVAGGVPPYSIVSWSGGASGSFNGTLSATASNLHAGTYTAVVSDYSGKQLSTTCTVSEPPQLVASADATPILCYGGTSTVTVSATGGTPPYVGTGTFSDLYAGDYSYIVTDANGCESTVSITITQPEKMTIDTTVENAICNPYTCNGSISIEVNGGTAPYSYSWFYSAGGTTPTGSVFENICPGTFAIATITDANGCAALTGQIFVGCRPNNCDPLRTYTMGGWGAPTPACDESNTFTGKVSKQSIGDVTEPNNLSTSETIGGGNSPAIQYLYGNFAAAFPYGLNIGCGNNKIILTSPCAVTRFLPSGGPSVALTGGIVVNPVNIKNNLAGQICAATLSMVFDSYDPDFVSVGDVLANRYVQSGTFAGMKVSEVLAEGNKKVGGCSSPYSFADLTAAITAINENFDNGDGTDQGFLGCTAPAGRMAAVFSGDLYPNPAQDASTVKVEAAQGQNIRITVADFMGRTLVESNTVAVKGINEIQLPLQGITARQCIVRVSNGSESFTKILSIRK